MAGNMFGPPPLLAELGWRVAFDTVNDPFADDGEEFVSVAAAAGGEEEARLGWVVRY
jgi:hypothetical protein